MPEDNFAEFEAQMADVEVPDDEVTYGQAVTMNGLHIFDLWDHILFHVADDMAVAIVETGSSPTATYRYRLSNGVTLSFKSDNEGNVYAHAQYPADLLREEIERIRNERREEDGDDGA